MLSRATTVSLLAAVAVSGCGPVVCNVPATAFAERDQATGLPIVTVRCGSLLIARAVCRDGGGKRRTERGWAILCDGEVIANVNLPKDVTP